MNEGTTYRYLHCGVIVESAIRIDNWRADDSARPAEVAITCARGIEPATPPFEQFETDGDAVRFAVEGVGEWRIQNGERIAIRADSGITDEVLALFTAGSAWAALGGQRGWVQWHGSAVMLPGARTVLLAGESGAGKSTMAAALIARGGRLVADDFSRVEFGEAPVIYPSSGRIRLGIDPDRSATDGDHYAGKAYVAVPSIETDRVGLDGIVILAWGEETRCDRLGGAEAVAALVEATAYRPELDALTGRHTVLARAAMQAAKRLPVVRFTRTRNVEPGMAAAFLSDALGLADV